ncbi:archaemetzincin family Zn-dependent metalloprotease [soil metagenome]
MVFVVTVIGCTQYSNDAVIAIQPLGTIPQEQIELIKEAIASVYDLSVIVLPARAPFASAYTPLKGNRYRADTTIAILKRTRPDSVDFIMGITNFDICITKYAADGTVKKPEHKYADFGIFGLGYRPGPSCVVSTFRLGDFNTEITKNRLAKICVHELGHNFGLPHCPDKKCVMTDAVESIATVDNAELRLCKECKATLGMD